MPERTRSAPKKKAKPAKAPAVPRKQDIGERSAAFAIEAARLLHDDKCEDVAVLDVRHISPVSDYIVIASGTSERQMRSVLTNVMDMGEKQGFGAFHSSKDDRATWLLADFVHVVVHVFEPNTRAHYDLEMLWGDAKRIAWERPAGSRPKAGRSAQ